MVFAVDDLVLAGFRYVSINITTFKILLPW